MSEKKLLLKSAIENVFLERSKFLVIGLTGRTGSGCTTTATTLGSNEPFEKCFPRPIEMKDRDYSICHSYLHSNWHAFEIIRVRDLITSYFCDYPYASFVSFCTTELRKAPNDVEDALAPLRETFERLHCERKRIESLPESNDVERLAKARDSNAFYSDVSIFSSKVKETIDALSTNSFIKLYQIVGNNLRLSGNPYCNEFSPDKFYTVARRINRRIKSIRMARRAENLPARIVIDAFRNPFEVSFFRDRYSAFYLLSLSCSNDDRSTRLRITSEELSALDKQEDSGQESGKIFSSQNLPKCIELADLHISNEGTLTADQDIKQSLTKLKKFLVRYIALMLHPGLVTPTHEERVMQVAISAKLNSGCISRQVGAAICDATFSVKSIGWNDVPYGQISCLQRSATEVSGTLIDDVTYSDYEIKEAKFQEKITRYKQHFEIFDNGNIVGGRNLSYCFKKIQNEIDGDKNQVHTRALHAEENAFLQLTKYGGHGVDGGWLFTTASPCELCSKKAYQLGIKQIVYIDPYPGISTKHVLKIGPQSSRPALKLFNGAIGRAYISLYQPFMAYKDELEMLKTER